MINLIFAFLSVVVVASFYVFFQLSSKNSASRASVRLQNFLRYFNSLIFVCWFSALILFLQANGCRILSSWTTSSFVTDLMVWTYITTLIIVFFSNKFKAFCFPIYLGKEVGRFNNALLYLRAFSEDGNSGCNKILKLISNRTYGIVAIANPKEVVQKIEGEKIYADDSEWQEVVSRAFSVSKFIIINVANTDGCLWELHKAFEGKFYDKCVFLVTSEDSYNVLRRLCYKYTGSFSLPRFHQDSYQFFVPKFEQGNAKVIYWRMFSVNKTYNKEDVALLVNSLLKEFPEIAQDIDHKRKLLSHPMKNLFKKVCPKGFNPLSFAGISLLAYPFVARLNKLYWLLGIPFLLAMLVSTLVTGHVHNSFNVGVTWAFALFLCVAGKKMMYLSYNWVSEEVISNRLNYMAVIALFALAIGYVFGILYVFLNPEAVHYNVW